MNDPYEERWSGAWTPSVHLGFYCSLCGHTWQRPALEQVGRAIEEFLGEAPEANGEEVLRALREMEDERRRRWAEEALVEARDVREAIAEGVEVRS